jgi:hypothetical protein
MKVRSTPRSAREATIWRIVRHIHLRVISKMSGRHLFALSEAEQEQALDGFHAAMETDADTLAEVMDEARRAGIAAAHVRLHLAEGVNHEDVDRSVVEAREDDSA